MGDGHSRFEQDETSGRLQLFGATRQRLVRQGVVISLRIVTAQRQLETVFTGRSAMTRPRIAPHLRHHRQHVIAETPREGITEMFHRHRRRGLMSLVLRSYRSLAVRLWMHVVFFVY